MKTDYVIVGSGLAAVGAAKALIDNGIKPTIFDCGKTLPGSLDFLKNKLPTVDLQDWNESEVESIMNNPPNKENFFSIPKKLVFGSDFFIGTPSQDYKIKIKNKMIPPFSRAFGGLSNGWGAASLPQSKYDICDWPLELDEILYHYEKVIMDLPFSGAQDGLNEEFPILKKEINSLKLSAQDEWLIKVLDKGRSIQKGRYVFGQARLLIQADTNSGNVCKYCSLCEDGCKYGLIYKASDSFMKWLQEDKIDYIPNVIIKSYEENQNGKVVLSFEDIDAKLKTILCKRVFIAAGAVPSSKIFLESNNNPQLKLKIKTRGGYVLPVWRIKGFKNTKNMNSEPGVFMEFRGNGIENWAHVQISSSNKLLEDRLTNGFLSWPIVNIFVKFVLRHLVILLVNFHSNHSGHYEISLDKKDNSIISNYKSNKILSKNFTSSLFQISRTLLPIGIIPLPFFRINSGTYHVGSSIPMKKNPKKESETDTEGRPNSSEKIHFVDSSIFPNLPGTTIGILSMANAHRIVSNVLKVHNKFEND